MSATIAIIGASHAAVQTISSLRELGCEYRIALIEKGLHLPYQRPPLSKKYLLGELSLEQMQLKPESFYRNAHVDLLLGRRAASIDRGAKKVVLDSGESLSYEKVVLATGTRPRELRLPGSDEAELGYLRTMSDAERIAGKLKPGAHVLIVGAGYIGLELAASARKQQCKVTVLEALDRVLARVTCPFVSRFYEALHAQEGAEIRLSASLDRFEKIGDKTRAVLSDGESLDADLVVVGVGVIPNTGLAESSGLDCDNGILVNEYAQTVDPDIYAVGDCANFPSARLGRRLRLESVQNAVEQAKTAASSICGNHMPYDQVPWFWSDQYDVKLQTVGLWDSHDAFVVRGNPQSRKFAVFYLQQDRLVAVDAINSPAEFLVSKKLIAAGAKPHPSKLEDAATPLKSLLN